jgi:hypothetical protein
MVLKYFLGLSLAKASQPWLLFVLPEPWGRAHVASEVWMLPPL